MKISIIQSAGQPTNLDANLNYISSCCKRASEQGANLLITPEMFVTGYNIGANTRALAQSATDSIFEFISRLCIKHGINILYGYAELTDNKQVFNSAQLINSHGHSILNYRKQHLFGDIDKNWFSAGDVMNVVSMDNLQVGVLICYDVEFPESVRELAVKGAQLIIVPTSLMKPFDFVATHLVPVRAWENQVFLAYANRVGSEAELEYCGSSVVVGPDGKDIARAGQDEDLLTADIDLSLIERVRSQQCYLSDRRRALYNL